MGFLHYNLCGYQFLYVFLCIFNISGGAASASIVKLLF